MSTLSAKVLEQLRQQLEKRATALRREIQHGLRKSADPRAVAMVDRLEITGDDALDDLEASLDITMVERDFAELRAVEAARKRMTTGDYGICIDCGEPVGAERLMAAPEAARCIRCQEKFERAGGRPASL